MDLVSVRVAEAPSGRGRVRLVGDVVYDRRAAPEQYWYEVPETCAASLTQTGNPWLACLLPLAVSRAEPLRLCRPVDPVLAENAARLMRIWKEWHPRLAIVPIEAERLAADDAPTGETAALFSGGVDSFFTVLRNAEPLDRSAFPRIDRLLSVGGFDVELERSDEFERLRERLAVAARDLGKELVDVVTNLRETRLRDVSWGRLAHGCALASVGLALERRFATVYIAATYTGGPPIRPWGSHPETDPLMSTSRTRIVHDGAGVGRFEKTEYVSRSAAAMRALHVCPRTRGSDNCGDCRKCFLVMLTLEVVGALRRCEAFEGRHLDLERVAKTYLKSRAYEYLFQDIEGRARAAGRTDLADAIARCVIRTRRLNRLLAPTQWLKEKRGLWRLSQLWRDAVIGNSPF